MYNFKIDTVDNFRIKTYWPKVPGLGETGISFKKLDSGFDLGIRGKNLNEKKYRKLH